MKDDFIEFANVKRTALVLKPRQAFWNWVKSIDPEFDRVPLDDNEPDVYLLPDYETKEQMERWLKKNFDELFTEQMNNWYVDDSLWAQNRTFKLFNEYFDYSLHTMVWDGVEGAIQKI